MRGRKRRGRPDLADEPLAEGDDWCEWGGEQILAAGFTAGGAPYGVSVDEFRAASMEAEWEAGWARAKRALRDVATARARGARVEVGWVRKVGDGLSREVFAADVDVSPDPGGITGVYAALVPRRDADPGVHARALGEARLLQRLGRMRLAIDVPDVGGAVRQAVGAILVRRFLPGVSLDPRAGRQAGVRPWEVVAEVAAAIHAAEVAALGDAAAGHATRREHAEAALAAFDGLEEPEARDALAWARTHLPEPRPATLIHGDLLGQNILLRPDGPRSPRSLAVIDWEYAGLGDPAYDLAIVTRGVRRPFQIERGFDRLLEAYAARGGAGVSVAGVRLHELCLAARWYRAARAGRSGEPPGEARALLRRVLGMACATRA